MRPPTPSVPSPRNEEAERRKREEAEIMTELRAAVAREGKDSELARLLGRSTDTVYAALYADSLEGSRVSGRGGRGSTSPWISSVSTRPASARSWKTGGVAIAASRFRRCPIPTPISGTS